MLDLCTFPRVLARIRLRVPILDPVCCFEGARYVQHQEFRIEVTITRAPAFAYIEVHRSIWTRFILESVPLVVRSSSMQQLLSCTICWRFAHFFSLLVLPVTVQVCIPL